MESLSLGYNIRVTKTMTFTLQILGAAEQVTGSMYLVRTPDHCILLECGLIQGSRADESRNSDPFPFAIDEIDAVVLSHAHIDHSGRLPLLIKRGYEGPIYAQAATHHLCEIMLPDSGYINEKEVEWENRRRAKKDLPPIEALYTRMDGEACAARFTGTRYEQDVEIVPGLILRFHDAGHILGSAIVELEYRQHNKSKTLVFSGDLGHRDAPVMNPPVSLRSADAVLMESTYGDRLHRPFPETLVELQGIFESASAARGNIMIPAFTVGRTQDLLYLMAEHYEDWQLGKWDIFLDSPMGISATETYANYRHLYGAKLFGPVSNQPNLPNFQATRSTEESMAINTIRSGAIIIAGSGMCSGGRIHHHLKYNISRPECHLIIVGFQAYGTLGRRIVDGADEIKLWGEKHPVRAQVHTVGGLSAHADQADLIAWYAAYKNRPPLYLVHGEPHAQQTLATAINSKFKASTKIASLGQTIEI
jgi:metallo-beta-lactamase family protein